MLDLRLLDPTTDLDLFHEAYNWRTRPKKHVQPDRLPFSVFTAPDPRHLTIGVFNGDFIACFFLWEFEPKRFECHFTSRRNGTRETVLEGAVMIRNCLFENGAEELTAFIKARNRPLRHFVEALGFTAEEYKRGQIDTASSTLRDDAQAFIKYGLRRNPP